jgi:hypothetical protein
LDRVLCTRLIARQFAYRPNVRREISTYGVEGAVKLCSGRALFAYVLPLGLVLIVLGLTGHSVAAVIVWLLMMVVFAFSLGRLFSASRAGRRWRESQRLG